MTTHDKIGRDEVVAKALADLEALRQLDICDPFELTRPFRQFAVQLTTRRSASGPPGDSTSLVDATTP